MELYFVFLKFNLSCFQIPTLFHVCCQSFCLIEFLTAAFTNFSFWIFKIGFLFMVYLFVLSEYSFWCGFVIAYITYKSCSHFFTLIFVMKTCYMFLNISLWCWCEITFVTLMIGTFMNWASMSLKNCSWCCFYITLVTLVLRTFMK